MSNAIRHFTDIDLAFGKNPLTNDINKKVDANAIKQSLYNLLMNRPFDVPFHPEISSQVPNLLFENFTPLTKISLERVIQNVINNFEPRVSLNSVEVSEYIEKNAISITLRYSIVNTNKPQTYQFYVYRAR